MHSPHKTIIKKQKAFFKNGATKHLDFRIESLKRLEQWIQENESKIFTALKLDLRKSPFESFMIESMGVLSEVQLAIKKLRCWARPQRVSSPLFLFPSSNKFFYEPFGSVLTIGAWNYPFLLGLIPAIGALAAGNCCVIKPSELAPYTSTLLAEMAHTCFDEEYVAVIEGDAGTVTQLLDEQFDFIHYTGGSRVGKIIAMAAARNLTPTVLELGGKSPCIVDDTAEIEISAQRICLGKFVNAGQTCVAPDYIMVDYRIKDTLIQALKTQIINFYGTAPQESPDYCRIINERHFTRLSALLNNATIVHGGNMDKNDLYIEPTIIDAVEWDDPVMQEEIFGPILPILTYDNLEDAIKRVQTKEKPLAVYVFSKNKKVQQHVMRSLQFGGGCINTVGMHVMNPHLPFGGIGQSGMGNYRGKWSFATFSHKKSIMNYALWPNITLALPPYREKFLQWLKWL